MEVDGVREAFPVAKAAAADLPGLDLPRFHGRLVFGVDGV